jgi:hypothetical protein
MYVSGEHIQTTAQLLLQFPKTTYLIRWTRIPAQGVGLEAQSLVCEQEMSTNTTQSLLEMQNPELQPGQLSQTPNLNMTPR